MWLSGKLYELLPFDKHMWRQYPLCKCPVGRGIVLHISTLPRSRRVCREYEWDWGSWKTNASPGRMTSLTALMTVNISAKFLSGCISWLAFQRDGAHPLSRMCSSTVNNLQVFASQKRRQMRSIIITENDWWLGFKHSSLAPIASVAFDPRWHRVTAALFWFDLSVWHSVIKGIVHSNMNILPLFTHLYAFTRITRKVS